jgi:hypothetical protein
VTTLFYAKNLYSAEGPAPVGLRCPGCRNRGTFEGFGINDQPIGENGAFKAGQRRCPNPDCRAHVFVIHQQGKPVLSYPAERIGFDPVNIPAGVLAALEEAITCHANQCFVASAIMVRKTLEELCHDQQVTGKTLKDRLAGLRAKVVLPNELFAGLDDLRLLGNDAAHIESQQFNRVGKEEVEVGIEFTKEVLKAVYQMSALLQRLRALKKP